MGTGEVWEVGVWGGSSQSRAVVMVGAGWEGVEVCVCVCVCVSGGRGVA